MPGSLIVVHVHARVKPDAIEAFDRGLAERGIDRRIVTYPGAPHSFFDRKATEFAQQSDAAWGEVLAFIEAQTRG